MSESIDALQARERAEALLGQAGIQVEGLQPQAGGAQHLLFKLTEPGAEQRLLKIPRRENLEDRSAQQGLAAEAEAISRLRGVKLPEPYLLLDGGAIMAHVPGQSAWFLYKQGRLSLDGLPDLCFEMGRQLSAIHRCRKPADYQGAIPERPELLGATPRLVHGDYHLGNVQVVRDPRKGWTIGGVVDWVNCCWGPRELDFVELHLSVFRQLPGTREAFLGGYRAGGSLPPDPHREKILLRTELHRRLSAGEVPEGVTADWMRWLADLQ